MVRERIEDWLDNPILVKHLRSRLRLQPLMSSIVAVQALCLCIAWAGFQLDGFLNGGAFAWLLFFQFLIIVAMGGAQVAAAVGGSRATGILDFHRVSPLSRAELVLGFFFGAPIREYVLLATTLPYSLLCVGFAAPTMLGLIQVLIALIAFAWLFHGMALLSALLAKPRAGARGAIALIVFLVIALWSVGANFIGRSTTLLALDQRLSFYGLWLPWLPVVLIYIASALFFVYLAARRRIGSDRIHPLSKIQAIAAMVTLSILLVGGIWRQESYDILQVVALYFLVATSLVMLAMVTPSQAEYLKGLLRARKQGQSHLLPWDDLSLNRVCLAVLCAILLVTGTIIWRAGVDAPQALPPQAIRSFPLGVAMAVVVIGYFGLAMQYFFLRFGARGKTYFGLFLFLAWLLPMVAGTIVAMSGARPMETEYVSGVIYSLSPLAGIATSSLGVRDQYYAKLMQGAAITPALFFAFGFNSLLTAARRRVYRSFLARPDVMKSTAAAPDPLALDPAAA